jgi:nitrous oxidase accessory protein
VALSLPRLTGNKKAVFALFLVSLLVLCMVKVQVGKADPRTIVVPEDYATIMEAVGNATDGDTIFVEKGIYEEETLEINTAVSIIGQDAENTIVNLHPPIVTTTVFTQTLTTYADPVNIKADAVKLSGLTLNSEGGEIAATGNRTQIAGNILNISVHLYGWNQTVSENEINASVTCSVGSYGNVYRNTVVNGSIWCDSGSFNRFFANTFFGGEISSGGTSSNNLIYGNTVKNGKGIGAFHGDIVAENTVTGSEKGIIIAQGSGNVICGNVITNNHGAGLTKLQGANNTFYANYLANNSVGVEIGVISLNPQNTTFYHNNFIQNIQQTNIVNLDTSDCWDNGEEGNYWSNYTGSDANRDSLGDTPYVIFGERHPYNNPDTTYAESYEDRYPLMTPFNCSNVNIELPEWATNQSLNLLSSPDITPPTVSVLSLGNMTYLRGDLSLTFTASEPVSWIGYSLDGQENITVTEDAVLTGLFVGSHYLTVYANDTVGNTGASETIYFRIETPFPTTLVAAVAITACVFGFGLIVNIIAGKRKSNDRRDDEKVQQSPLCLK